MKRQPHHHRRQREVVDVDAGEGRTAGVAEAVATALDEARLPLAHLQSK